ncbi:hypothetical protein B0H15DRAFT_803736 [Mycena belliarum]|uniref:BTB domain-containing protein n=1 Tax=Mycena belliarum TaxID=1033014 RepID=A0AAD6XM95_9AGAR|nr:hypothetical protein B0H15DRAFT_803736 [Mycena belliae]
MSLAALLAATPPPAQRVAADREPRRSRAVTATPLFCGAVQPFDGADVDAHRPGRVQVLPIEYGEMRGLEGRENARKRLSSDRDTMARAPARSNGCGTLVHAGATPQRRGSMTQWRGNREGAADVVVPLEDKYVPDALKGAVQTRREGCGCLRSPIGCAVCGNPLGAVIAHCTVHTHFDSPPVLYEFAPSAVSPPLPATADLDPTSLDATDATPTGTPTPAAPPWPPWPPIRTRGPHGAQEMTPQAWYDQRDEATVRSYAMLRAQRVEAERSARGEGSLALSGPTVPTAAERVREAARLRAVRAAQMQAHELRVGRMVADELHRPRRPPEESEAERLEEERAEQRREEARRELRREGARLDALMDDLDGRRGDDDVAELLAALDQRNRMEQMDRVEQEEAYVRQASEARNSEQMCSNLRLKLMAFLSYGPLQRPTHRRCVDARYQMPFKDNVFMDVVLQRSTASKSSFPQTLMSIEELSAETPPELVRSTDVWFEDGTVVLQADSTLFRVYRGVLSAQSPIFRDAFTIPQPSEEEAYEGCPVVTLHDSAEDLTLFLLGLLDAGYAFILPSSEATCSSPPGRVRHFINSPIPNLHALASVLRLGRKYEVEHLCQRATSVLRDIYPATLTAFLARKPPPGYTERTGDDFRALALAQEHQVRSALPGIYYACARQGPGAVLASALAFPDKARCVRATETFRTHWTRRIHAGLFPTPACATPGHCDAQRFAWLRGHGLPDFDGVFAGDFKWGEVGLCTPCIASAATISHFERAALWIALPALFDLPPWKDLVNSA